MKSYLLYTTFVSFTFITGSLSVNAFAQNMGQSLPLCDGSYQDCITERGDVCEAGSTDHECEIDG